MKKLLVVIGLILALCIPTVAFSDELAAPFTKVKESVIAKGISVNDTVKAIEFEITNDEYLSKVVFIAADNGNVGIAVINKSVTEYMLVGFDATSKVYFVMRSNASELVTQNDATEWGFQIFRLLVIKGLI